MLVKCIDDIYNDIEYREIIKETFTTNGYIMCHKFFKSEVVEMLSNELFSNNVQWKVKGPMNKR